MMTEEATLADHHQVMMMTIIIMEAIEAVPQTEEEVQNQEEATDRIQVAVVVPVVPVLQQEVRVLKESVKILPLQNHHPEEEIEKVLLRNQKAAVKSKQNEAVSWLA